MSSAIHHVPPCALFRDDYLLLPGNLSLIDCAFRTEPHKSIPLLFMLKIKGKVNCRHILHLSASRSKQTKLGWSVFIWGRRERNYYISRCLKMLSQPLLPRLHHAIFRNRSMKCVNTSSNLHGLMDRLICAKMSHPLELVLNFSAKVSNDKSLLIISNQVYCLSFKGRLHVCEGFPLKAFLSS